MRSVIYGVVVVSLLLAAGCGAPKDELTKKKEELKKELEKQAEITANIEKLEADIALLDTTEKTGNVKLVSTMPVESGTFSHYIDLQGKIDAENVAFVTPRGAGGQVRQVFVKQGDYVKKGQLLLKLDDVLANQQIEQIEVQLGLAKDLYQRRENLWKQNIGTEVELLQAKNNVEALEKQLALLREQSNMSNIYAQLSGVADMVNIKPGEFFSPQSATQMGIRIVNTDNLKLTAQVPETYIDRVKEGTPVEIHFPDVDKTIQSKISVKGRTIDPGSRSFYIEARIPSGSELRPNQLALVKIRDYVANNALTIPIRTLQNDEKGKFVMLMVNENGKAVARKQAIEVGELTGNQLEVKSGLKPGDIIITEGFQGLYDGQQVSTSQL